MLTFGLKSGKKFFSCSVLGRKLDHRGILCYHKFVENILYLS